jgi:thioesterase domain-containing protein
MSDAAAAVRRMIDPIRATGPGFPVAMVHGLFGVVALARPLAEAFGREHPFFAIHARALVGDPHDSVGSMARDYLAALRSYCPRGPYILGGMCAGALIALEMARLLRMEGETIPTVVMLEPNPVLNLNPPKRQLEPILEQAAAAQLTQSARAWFAVNGHLLDSVPLDVRTLEGLEKCAEAGAKLIFAYERHRVQPYSGQVDIIASEPFAKLITNPNLPWRKEILLGNWAMHTIHGTHEELFAKHAGPLLGTIHKVVRSVDEKTAVARA